ncbi:hypothetical protein [Tenacibaculum finnmarkense]|uniref:hypothetical protein n=1 Tax=Tenacibaculum finnmarkense TaxID=2781243 RepID=UPI001EFAA9F0|nr:hypothetical protein [Tenacibaculum finnmarkense]MCG8748079.1 leucine-rich repeat domain-containing protein [Tenacibaculum finnmarkense]MCG8760965.1 leucine-rich repeat domain-containing protein [Tenacibaculum finnmarkense]
MGMASSRRYGMQEITMVTTSTDSEWKVSRAESSSIIKWYALGNTYRGDTPTIDFSGNVGRETVVAKSSRGLTYLECSAELTELDASKNSCLTHLKCNGTRLKILEVSKNTLLTHLECVSTELAELDVSKNLSLTYLNCNDCGDLAELDVSKNTLLTFLSCYHKMNNLTTIYVNQTQLNNIPSGWQKEASATYVLKQ